MRNSWLLDCFLFRECTVYSLSTRFGTFTRKVRESVSYRHVHRFRRIKLSRYVSAPYNLLHYCTNLHLACDSSCSTCAGTSGFCLTCSQSSQFALDGKCVSSCPANTFAQSSQSGPNGSGGVCSPCHGDCETCSGSRFDQCVTCKQDGERRVLSKNTGRCLRSCTKGEWFDDVGGAGCKACPDGCTSCVGGGSGQCTGCDAGRGLVLKEGRCVASSCTMGTIGVLGGVCLEALAEIKLDTQVPTSNQTVTPVQETKETKGLQWWMYVLIGGSVLGLVILGLIIWRWRARKRRAMQTKMFKQRIEMGGVLQSRFSGVLGRLSRWTGKKHEVRDEELKRRQDFKSSIRWPSDRFAVRQDTETHYDDGYNPRDLEGAAEEKQRRGVEEWRKRISTTQSTTTWTTESTEEDHVPEMPVATKRRGHHRRESSSDARTLSQYSQITHSARTSSSRRSHRKTPPPLLQEYRPSSGFTFGSTYDDLTIGMKPQPKQPLKDTSFVARGASGLNPQMTGSNMTAESHLTGQSSGSGISRPSIERFGLAQLSTQPLIDAPPTQTTTLAPFQTSQPADLINLGGVAPLMTGSGGNVGVPTMGIPAHGTGTSSNSSRIIPRWIHQEVTGSTVQSQLTGGTQHTFGDKNPFRNRMI
ncbi:hypothetical protein FRC02_010822 [Tulasnella sp. 418]|nr:hypothetical protein FRC02_010822 [Tulasnella sp. 418]